MSFGKGTPINGTCLSQQQVCARSVRMLSAQTTPAFVVGMNALGMSQTPGFPCKVLTECSAAVIGKLAWSVLSQSRYLSPHKEDTVKSIQQLIPRSRVNLTYETNVQGQLKEVELPFRLIVLADLSHGTSTDRSVDLETRRLRNLDAKNIDELMENMKIRLKLAAKNHLDPEAGELEVDIPITNRKSFNPAEVASNIPQIRSLLLLRKVLLEMMAQVDNRKDVRNLLQQILGNAAERAQLRKELEPFGNLKLLSRKELAPRTVLA